MTLVVDLLPEVQLQVMVVALAEELEESENQDQILLELIRDFQVVIVELHDIVLLLILISFLSPFIFSLLLVIVFLILMMCPTLLDDLIIHHLILMLHVLFDVRKILLDHLLDLDEEVIEAIFLEMLKEGFLGCLISPQEKTDAQVEAL